MKSRDGKSQRREEKKKEDQRRESQKKEDPGAREGRKVAKRCVSGGSTSRLAKAAGAEPPGQMRDEKLHAIVARSAFPSQHVQSTPCSDHFGKLRCRKSALFCGAKHVSKSKCTKHTMLGPLLEVEVSKKCTPLWREAHFEVKLMYKTYHVRPTLEVRCRKSARSCRCGVKQILQKTEGYGSLLVVLRGRRKGLCTLPKVGKTSGLSSSFNYSYYTTLHSTTLH